MSVTPMKGTGLGMRPGGVNVVHAQSPLSALATRPAVTVPSRCTLARAVAQMEASGISALLVDDRAGIITERDIARALAHGASVDEVVGRVATPHPLIVPASMTVVEACATMLNEHVRHLVVELAGGLAVISLRDVAAVLLQSADPHIWLASLRVAIEVPAEIWLG